MNLTDREREVMLEALYTAPSSKRTKPQERTAVALKLQMSDDLSMTQDRMVQALVGTIQDLRRLIVTLTETFGGLCAAIENLPSGDYDLQKFVVDSRQWLLDVKQIDVQIAELVKIAQEL